MDINYYNKYLKYKSKFVDLKKSVTITNYNQLGGNYEKFTIKNINDFDTFIFDMDGVMKGMTPELEYGAILFINKLYSKNKELYWITNNPELSREEVIDDLLNRGVNFGVQSVIDKFDITKCKSAAEYRVYCSNNKNNLNPNTKKSIYESNIDKIFCVSYIIYEYVLKKIKDGNKIYPLIYSLQRSNDDLFIDKTDFKNPYTNKGIVAELNKIKDITFEFKIFHYLDYIKKPNSDIPTYDMIYDIVTNGYNTLITGWDGLPDPKVMLLLGNIIYILDSINYNFDIVVCSPDLSGSSGEMFSKDQKYYDYSDFDENKKKVLNELKNKIENGLLKKRAIGTGSTGNFFTSISSISKKITYLGKPSDFLVNYINEKLYKETGTGKEKKKKKNL